MNESPSDRTGEDVAGSVLDNALRSMSHMTIPQGPPTELMQATLAILQGPEPTSFRFPMSLSKSKLMKTVSISAVLLITTCVSVLLLSDSKSASAAYTDAIARLRDAKMLSFTSLATIEGEKLPFRTKQFYSDDGRHRSESKGVVTIYDKTMTPRLMLIESAKFAFVPSQLTKPSQAPLPLRGWLDALKVKGMAPDQKLGEQTVNGRRSIGFVTTHEESTFVIWVDVASNEIVQIEHDSAANGKGSVRHYVWKDFEFNQEVDDSLFSIDVPEGYTFKALSPRSKGPSGK